MAAPTSTPYNHARYLLETGALDLSTGTIKMALVTSTYTPDLDNHQFFSSVTNELSTANGYTAGGATLANKACTKGTNKTKFSSDAVVWNASGAGITARRAIIYKDTGNAATSPLLCVILLDSAPADVVASAGGTLTLTPDSTNGWLYI